jgi:signal transduction histidine kinase
MTATRPARLKARLAGPPLALQIVGLLLGGLIIAQLVTLFLTMILPPEPQPQYGMAEIAATLSGSPVKTHPTRPLQRIVQSGPPAFSGPGWLTSDRARRDLAKLLGRDEADVQIFFFTPLPFAGTVPRRGHEVTIEPESREHHTSASHRFVRYASYEEHHPLPKDLYGGSCQVVMPTAGDARFPGGGFPGGFPGGGFPGAFPGGGIPGTAVPAISLPSGTFRIAPNTAFSTGPIAPSPVTAVPSTIPLPGGMGAAVPGTATVFSAPNAGTLPSANLPTTTFSRPTLLVPAPIVPDFTNPVISQGTIPDIAPAPPMRRASSAPRLRSPETELHVPSPRLPPVTEHRPEVQPVSAAPPVVSRTISNPVPINKPAPRRAEYPVPVSPRAERGLFGMAPAPFIEGDFVAAVRLDDGRWVVVRPTPEPFPNSWQRRVILWFLISFALVAPLGWIFARRLVRPIAGFAYAAEQLGRDPTASILALEGPAEVGRAAHAFNRMQSRLRSFVDDRTAMVGAISHDLRTPLTRLRFRIEDIPDDQREGMLAEVEEMEQMISSVLTFIRDASEPGSRETLDLRTLVEDVVEDAVFVGKAVTLEDGDKAQVEVDPLGIRRLVSNLVENAVKYGTTARVRLFTDQQEAVAEIRDDGPGLPEEELERVFQPFYRTPDAHASNKLGAGLGLAVCRSIARAHGGDVRLHRGDSGLIAQLRLPLAYGAAAS